MPHGELRWLDPDLDVVAQPIQAVHQLSFRQVGEVAFQHGRHLGLGNAHSLGGGLLRQAKLAHGLGDLDDQAGFDLQFVSARSAKIFPEPISTSMPTTTRFFISHLLCNGLGHL